MAYPRSKNSRAEQMARFQRLRDRIAAFLFSKVQGTINFRCYGVSLVATLREIANMCVRLKVNATTTTIYDNNKTPIQVKIIPD